MRVRPALLSLTLVAPLLALGGTPPGPAAAAAPTCQGRPATIVNTPDDRQPGTDEDDVIVSTGGADVAGFGGDDLICLVDLPPLTSKDRTYVFGGVGDDSILVDDDLADGGYAKVRVSLGAGADTFRGGPGSEYVTSVEIDEADPAAEGDRDVITTGGGNDTVRPDVLPAGAVATDAVDLGAGNDVLLLDGPATSAGTSGPSQLVGGTGSDRVAFSADRSASIDARGESVVVDGASFAVTAGFEGWSVTTSGDVTFAGTAADERLEVRGRAELDVRLGGGDDTFVVDGEAVQRGIVRGSSGRDRIETTPTPDPIRIDLAAAVLQRGHRAAVGALRIPAFEDVRSRGIDSVVHGSPGANSLVVACGSVVTAGGGDDVVRERSDTILFGGCSGGISARGQGGADVLVGSEGTDVLLGGPGRDRADGLRRVDRCVAEVRHSCER